MIKGYGLTSLTGLLLLVACGGEVEPKNEADLGTSGIELVQDSMEQVRLYTLPAPLQTAEYLSSTSVPFNDSLLYPLPSLVTSSTVFYDAIELGMAMVDVSYMISYGEHARATTYIKRAKQLSSSLHIKDQKLGALGQRFEENKEYPDSLKRIIQEGFQSGYAFFQQNGREGTGLLVVIGVFIEGMYHLINTEPQDFKREALMAYHQKNFVNNISELLERVDNVDGVPDLRKYFATLANQMEVIGVINHGVKLEGDVESVQKLPIDQILTELKTVRQRMLERNF